MARRKTVSSAKGNLGKPSGSNFQAWVEIAYGDFPSADEVEIYTVENIYVTDGDEGSWARVSYETEHHGSGTASIGYTGSWHGTQWSYLGTFKRGQTVKARCKCYYTGGSGRTYTSEASCSYTIPLLTPATVSVDKDKAKIGDSVTVTATGNTEGESNALLWNLVPVMNAAEDDKQPVADWVTFDWGTAEPGSSRVVSANDETMTFTLTVPYQFKGFKYLCLRVIQYQEWYGNTFDCPSETLYVDISGNGSSVTAYGSDGAGLLSKIHAYGADGKVSTPAVYAYNQAGEPVQIQ